MTSEQLKSFLRLDIPLTKEVNALSPRSHGFIVYWSVRCDADGQPWCVPDTPQRCRLDQWIQVRSGCGRITFARLHSKQRQSTLASIRSWSEFKPLDCTSCYRSKRCLQVAQEIKRKWLRRVVHGRMLIGCKRCATQCRKSATF